MKRNRVLAAMGVLSLLLAWLPALADSGDLDPTFGGDGTVTTDLGSSLDNAYAVAIQTDGRIVVAGASGIDFALARYEAGGALDTTFDGDGKVITDFGDLEEAYGLVIQADGKIVVAGYAATSGNRDLALARYNGDDGSLDSTFGNGGLLITDLGSDYDQGSAVAIQADGKILVAGHTYSGESYDFALVRYHGEDGSLDHSFGTGGLVSTDFAGDSDYAFALAIQTDGRIVVAGVTETATHGRDFALARYSADNGSLDATFGTGGLVTTHFGGTDQGRAVAIQGDQIVVAGDTVVSGGRHDFALARYNRNGSLDEFFGDSGLVTTDFAGDQDQGYAVACLPNGKILVAGRSNTGSDYDFALASYDAFGSLDDDFGLGGLVTTHIGLADAGHAMALQHDKIVVAGSASISGSGDFAVARYISDDVIVVNTTSDTKDGNTSSISALKASPGADGWISLREAILADNNTPGPNIINFNIPIPGVMTIEPETALPILTSGGTLIDGYSQPGAAPATATTPATILIAIDGSRVAANNGLNIASANNVIQGLAINRFPFNGIAIGGGAATGNTIAGNYIGLSIFGPADPGNDYNGVYIALGAKNNTVGGDNPAARNVICNSNWSGVEIHGANTTGNVVAGNYLGVGPSGTSACGNTLHGVRVYGSAHDNTIGPGNVIAYNSVGGVVLAGDLTTGNAITQNSIFANGGLGIDLQTGANNNMPPPVIDATAPGSIRISGTTCSGCTVEVFASPDAGGEGQVYLGSDTAEGGSFELVISALPYAYLTATATDATDGTSEFSEVFEATAPGHPIYLPLVARQFLP